MSVPVIASLLLAGVFAWAGGTKALRPERWRQDLQAYRLGRGARAAGLLLVPGLELGVTVALLAGAPRPAAAVALALLVAFSAAIIRARILVGSNQLACGCFGGHATRDYRLLLGRNAALVLLAASVMAFPGTLPFSRAGGALPWLLAGGTDVVAAAWVLWQVRIRLRVRQGVGTTGQT